MHCEIHPLRDVAEYIKTRIPEHYDEACKTNEYDPVSIDWPYFLALSDIGACYAVTLNEGNQNVGYTIMTISPDPLRKEQIEANNVCLYVKRSFRGVGTKKLLMKSKQFMNKLGAKKINYLVKNKALGRLLENLGATTQEQLWSLSA